VRRTPRTPSVSAPTIRHAVRCLALMQARTCRFSKASACSATAFALSSSSPLSHTSCTPPASPAPSARPPRREYCSTLSHPFRPPARPPRRRFIFPVRSHVRFDRSCTVVHCQRQPCDSRVAVLCHSVLFRWSRRQYSQCIHSALLCFRKKALGSQEYNMLNRIEQTDSTVTCTPGQAR
jgi:hypothetical protein